MNSLECKLKDMIEIKVLPFKTSMLHTMKEIDDLCYEGGYDVDMAWYAEAYSKLSEITVVMAKDKIVGYCGFIGLRPEIYDCYKLGLLKGDASLSEEAYVGLEEAEYLYLFMVALLPEYRGVGLGRALYQTALTHMKRYNVDMIAYCNAASRNLLKDFKDVAVVNKTHYIMEYKHY